MISRSEEKKFELVFSSTGNLDMQEAVSVIIPFFNMGDFVKDAIESVILQSYSNVEIILVDDGSTDESSIAIIDNLTLPNGKIIRTSNNGLSAARNVGIENSRGRFIVPLDADDMLAPSFIEECLSVLKSNINIGVVFSEVRAFGDCDERLDFGDFDLQKMLFHNGVVATAIYRKEHWVEFGGYKECMNLGLEDHEFWMNFFEAGLRFERVNKDLFYYRQYPTSMSKTVNKAEGNYRSMMLKIFNSHIGLYRENVELLFIRLIDAYENHKFRRVLFSISFFSKKRLRLVIEEK